MATPPFRIGKRPLYEFSKTGWKVPVANFPQYFETSQLGKYERHFVNKENLQKIAEGQNTLANWSATNGRYSEFFYIVYYKSRKEFFSIQNIGWKNKR